MLSWLRQVKSLDVGGIRPAGAYWMREEGRFVTGVLLKLVPCSKS